MANYPLLAAGQQAVTNVPTALPSVVPANPLGGLGLGGGASVRGEGVEVKLTNLKASTASLFYGNNSGPLSTANGKELAPGAQDVMTVNDLSQLFVVSAANGTATASWAVTNK